jgi:hypothetical protein
MPLKYDIGSAALKLVVDRKGPLFPTIEHLGFTIYEKFVRGNGTESNQVQMLM